MRTNSPFESTIEYLASIHRLMSPRETSEVLGVPVDRLAIWRISGRPAIQFIKLGPRDVRYDSAALADYLRRRIAENTSVANQLPDVDKKGTEAGKFSPNTGKAKRAADNG
jgi:hypothetical protein